MLTEWLFFYQISQYFLFVQSNQRREVHLDSTIMYPILILRNCERLPQSHKIVNLIIDSQLQVARFNMLGENRAK